MGARALDQSAYEYLTRMDPGPTVMKVLRSLADSQIPAGTHPEILADLLRDNQFYEHLLQRLDILQRMKSEWTGLDDDAKSDALVDHSSNARKILRLLGVTAARNAIVELRIMRMLGSGLPKKDNEPVKLEPTKRLRFASAAEDYCNERLITQPHNAYVAGLHWDWLCGQLDRDKKLSPLKTYLEELWKNSIQSAHIAYSISSIPQDFKFQPYAFASSLLLGLGRILMAINYPQGAATGSWLDFERETAKIRERNPLVRSIRERQKFALSHSELAGLAAQFFGFFKPVAGALIYTLEPNLIREVDRDQYNLSLILSVTEHLMAGGQEPTLTAYQKTRLSELGMRDVDVLYQAKKVIRR